MKLTSTDPQEILDISTEFFRTQPRSWNGCGCRYLTEDGRRCVVGNLIEIESNADELSLLRMDGGVTTLTTLELDLIPTASLEEFLTDLQPIHDLASNWNAEETKFENWDRFEQFAADYRLTFTRPSDTIQS